MKKKTYVILGHYGSGKTEFSMNYALTLRREGQKTAIVDLDIGNPYFRSREKKEFLNEKGIALYANPFGYEITAELPALAANTKAPFENPEVCTLVDVGGDDLGARILWQYKKYLTTENSHIWCVINGNRPETATVEGVLHHISQIQQEIGMAITGLVCNTHMLKETTIEQVLEGVDLCLEVAGKLSLPLYHITCLDKNVPDLKQAMKLRYDANLNVERLVFPIQIYMRETWLDL